MPHGAGKGRQTVPKPEPKKIFIGRGRVELALLRKSATPPTDSRTNTSASFDNGPPSPCSSTSLSYYSSTSDEAIITPEVSSCKVNRASLEYDWSSSGIFSDEKTTNPPDFVFRQPDFVGYSDKPTDKDFVPPPVKNDINSTQISSLSGLLIAPEVTKVKDAKKKGYRRNPNDLPFLRSKRYYANRGSVGSIPRVFSVAKPSSVDFVQAKRNRTPPPDFVERQTSQNLQTISHAPDLSVLLSGAVSKSALFRPDFIPTAVMPKDLRFKSKSLSDLSKKEEKSRRFLDRRKVIQMDLNDKECCSHTEVTPSSMMTLAMELLLAPDNKAASLFSEAKKRADGYESESDSILPKLWVVPKAPSPDSGGQTASHLKPILKATSSIDSGHKRESENEEYEHETSRDEAVTTTGVTLLPSNGNAKSHIIAKRIALSGQAVGDRIGHSEVKKELSDGATVTSGVVLRKKRPGYSYSGKCVAASGQKVQERDTGHRQNYQKVEKISQEDIERDLKNLTIADLVGSPDTVYTDTESEKDAGEQVTSGSIRGALPNQTNTSSPRELPQSCTTLKIRNGQSTNEVRYLPVSCETKGTEESICPFDSEITPPHVTVLETKKEERRSSSVSTSSSLTTVSSLSLSSGSMVSLDNAAAAKDSLKNPTIYPIHWENDSECPTSGADETRQNKIFEIQGYRSMDDMCTGMGNDSSECPTLGADKTRQNLFVTRGPRLTDDMCAKMETRDDDDEISRVPQPPRRSKSFGVMDKIRKTRQRKEGSSNLNLTEYRGMVKLIDSGRNTKKSHPIDESLRKSFEKPLIIPANGDQSSQNTSNGKIAQQHPHTQDSKHVVAIGMQLEERHPSQLLIPCSDGRSLACDMPESLHGYSQADTHGRAERVPSRKKIPTEVYTITAKETNGNTKKDRQDQITVYEPYQQAQSWLPFTEAVRSEEDMAATEKLFRNGEISVVSGSKVSLARKCSQPPITKNETRETYNALPAGMYLADVICAEESQQLGNYPRRPGGEDFITPSSTMPVESRPQISSHFQEPYQSRASSSGDFATEILPNSRTQDSFSNFLDPADLKTQHTQSLHDLRSSPNGSCAGRDRATATPSPTMHQTGTKPVENRTPSPYAKNSAIKLLTGKNVYTSSAKISLNPNKNQDSSERKLEPTKVQTSARLDSGPALVSVPKGGANDAANRLDNKPQRRNSFPSKDKREEKRKNVREAIGTDMKITETSDLAKPEQPAHSNVDEGDFAGVVDGPTKNVKEIRAMFKVRDYGDYAKPKMPIKKTSTGHPAKLRNDKITQNANRNSAEVAQQVMGLFKDALTLEDETTPASPPPAQHQQHPEAPTRQEETNEDEPHISVKDKVASFNSGKSPVKEIEMNNNIKEEPVVIEEEHIAKKEEKVVESVPYAEIITNPAPVTNGNATKTSVKPETVDADSYDESLDQFYGVLEELSSS